MERSESSLILNLKSLATCNGQERGQRSWNDCLKGCFKDGLEDSVIVEPFTVLPDRSSFVSFPPVTQDSALPGEGGRVPPSAKRLRRRGLTTDATFCLGIPRCPRRGIEERHSVVPSLGLYPCDKN